jgi:hypothetical protein
MATTATCLDRACLAQRLRDRTAADATTEAKTPNLRRLPRRFQGWKDHPFKAFSMLLRFHLLSRPGSTCWAGAMTVRPRLKCGKTALT